jgi:hypothetical protein
VGIAKLQGHYSKTSVLFLCTSNKWQETKFKRQVIKTAKTNQPKKQKIVSRDRCVQGLSS